MPDTRNANSIFDRWAADERESRRNAQRATEIAINHVRNELRAEIGLAWTRTAYMSTFQGFLIAALSLLLSESNSDESAIQFFAVFLCVAGIFLSRAWVLINHGSKVWQEHWEKILRKNDDTFNYDSQNLASEQDSEKRPIFSISRTNIRVSYFFCWFWSIAAIILTVRNLSCVYEIDVPAHFRFWMPTDVFAYVSLWVLTVAGLCIGFCGLKKKSSSDSKSES